MRCKTISVNYWVHDDNNCQIGAWKTERIKIKSLFIDTYDNIGLAQKLQYFWSPIKNTYW
jgi:hypothetical protein